MYHDQGNLNFSFICSEDRYSDAEQTGIILKTLEKLGIQAEVSGRNDITIEGRKFSGNAYCKRGDNRQRHGTLLVNAQLGVFDRYLNAPKQKLEAKGVTSVRARVCNLCEYAPGLTVERTARRCARRMRTCTARPRIIRIRRKTLPRSTVSMRITRAGNGAWVKRRTLTIPLKTAFRGAWRSCACQWKTVRS